MLNKKMLLSLLVIGVVSVTAGAGTWAYFSDTETSEGNTFTTGTLDIEIPNTFEFGDVAPGDVETETITIENKGSIAAKSVFLELDVVDTEPTTDTEPETVAEVITGDVCDISTMIAITSITYEYATNTVDISGKYTDSNGNGYLDLDDLNTADEVEINSDVDLLKSTTATVTIEMTLHTTTDNEYQGDMSTVTEIVTVTQE